MTEQLQFIRDPLRLTVCPECGYSLKGLPSEGVCPECGERYDQQFVVVFGENAEGDASGPFAHVGTLVILGAAVAVWLYFSLLRGGGWGAPLAVVMIFGAGLIAIRVLKRTTFNRSVLFQIWLNEHGYAKRRPELGGAALERVERYWVIGTFAAYLFAVYINRKNPDTLGDAVALGVMISVIASTVPRNAWSKRRRMIRTGDARVPRLVRWDRNDNIDVKPISDTAAHLRIVCRSYIGAWEFDRWHPVSARVRLSPEQVTLLRQQVDTWISRTMRNSDRRGSAEKEIHNDEPKHSRHR